MYPYAVFMECATTSLKKTVDDTEYKPLSNDNNAWQDTVQHIRTYLVPKIIYYPDFLFDFPEKILLNSEAIKTTEEKTYMAMIQDVLEYIQPDLSIEKHLVERMKSSNQSSKEALESTLELMGYQITKVVFSAWDKIFGKGGKEIVVTYGSEEVTVKKLVKSSPDETTPQLVNVKRKNYYLQFRVKEGPNRYSLNERSLGFKWFFSFLLFTEFRKVRKSDYGGILFLLDEPASNLHSTAQVKLLTTFKELVTKSSLIYTTHSHHLINPEWLSGAYIIKNTAVDYKDDFFFKLYETDITATPYRQFVANNPDQEDYFQPVLDSLDHKPGLLEKIPDILITEGKNDYYTLKYINKLYFDNQYDDINIFPGTGASTNRPVMALYLAWGRNFLLLLDGDKQGKQSQKDYINDLGKDVENRIITLCDVDNSLNNKTTEGLFNEAELISITKQFDKNATEYNKSKFNTALQNLLYSEEKVELSASTLEKFKKLFETVRSKIIANRLSIML